MTLRWLSPLALCALAGCYSASHPGDAGPIRDVDSALDAGVAHTVVARAKQPSAKPARDSADDAAQSGDVSALDDAGPGPNTDCPLPDGWAEDGSATDQEALTLEVASEPPLGVPFVLAVSTRSGAPLDAAVRVCANGVPLALLQLYRGRGSVTLRVSESGPLRLQARAAHAFGSRSVSARARPQQRAEAGIQEQHWTAAQDVVVDGVLRIAAGESLTIGPGTRVLLGANALIAVAGQLRVQGTTEDPVLFTRAGEPAWGGVIIGNGARAWVDHAWFVAGGGDASRAFGHSTSQPVVLVDSGALAMRGGGLVDNPGKAFGSRNARIELDGTLISRCDTGGQFDASRLTFRHLHVLEMPDGDGQFDDDDNDGFYIDNFTDDDAGVEAVIEDSVFARGEDDAIDQNGAKVRLERVWIEGFRHEGVACSNKRQLDIRDSVVRKCGQGIEAGYGAPRVLVERSLITENGVGIRYGDEYSSATSGTLDVSHSIIVGNGENVRNFVSKLGGPLPDALRVTCSVVEDAQLTGSAGNVPPPVSDASSCSSPLLDPQQCEVPNAGPACL